MVSHVVLRETTDRSRFKFEIQMIRRPPDADHSLVKQYLSDQPRADQKKIVSRIMQMAELGPHRNAERYGDLGEGIYELKVGQHRIPFFCGPPGVIVLTHGFFKRQDEAPPAEIMRARELRDLYREACDDPAGDQ